MAALFLVPSAPVPGGKPSVAVDALPAAESFPASGRKVEANPALPWETFSETDVATMVAPLSEDVSDPGRM